MNRLPLFFLVLAMLLAGCSSSNSYLSQSDKPAAFRANKFDQVIDFENIDTELLNASIFHASNEARMKHGRQRVGYEPVLEAAAQEYAERQARGGFLSHTDSARPGMATPKDRVAAAGAKNPLVAENLATTAGIHLKSGEKVYINPNGTLSKTPNGKAIPRHTYRSLGQSVVQQWMDSPGHRKNLLSKDARSLGCGSSHYMQNQIPSFVMVQNFQLYEQLK